MLGSSVADGSVRADWKAEPDLISSVQQLSPFIGLLAEREDRRGFQAAVCVTHGMCWKKKKKTKTDGQTCLGHETTQSKVQPELECFNNDEQGEREDKGEKKKSPFLALATQEQLLVCTSSFLQCVWIKKRRSFPTEECLKGSHYALDPGGGAGWVTPPRTRLQLINLEWTTRSRREGERLQVADSSACPMPLPVSHSAGWWRQIRERAKQSWHVLLRCTLPGVHVFLAGYCCVASWPLLMSAREVAARRSVPLIAFLSFFKHSSRRMNQLVCMRHVNDLP